jgi:hypothetical protein
MTYDLNTPAQAHLWAYEPDWRSGFRVRRSFLTDIATSRSKKEQRRALRDAPRLSLSYSTATAGDVQLAAWHHLRARQNRPTAVPDFARHALTTGSSSGGSSELTLASPPAWIAEDRHLVLCGAAGSELVVVDSVAGPTITLTAPLANAWPSGSVVRPGLFGLLSQNTRASQVKPSASLLDVTLNVYPGGEPPEDEGTAPVTFNGLELLTAEPDWSSPPAFDHIWPVEQVDFGIGRTAQFRPITQHQGLMEAQFTGLSPEGAQAFEQVFLRAKGMRGSFYRSTCQPDMALYAGVTGSTFVVTGSDIAADFGAVDFGEVSQAIEIVQTDGTRLRRLVTDIAASSGNSAITVNSSVTLTLATTARISWLPRVRFASDDLTTEWVSPRLARIAATFQTVDE